MCIHLFVLPSMPLDFWISGAGHRRSLVEIEALLGSLARLRWRGMCRTPQGLRGLRNVSSAVVRFQFFRLLGLVICLLVFARSALLASLSLSAGSGAAALRGVKDCELVGLHGYLTSSPVEVFTAAFGVFFIGFGHRDLSHPRSLSP